GIYVVADSKAKGNVTNTGRIQAAAATLASAGGNVYALAGNRQGLIQATGTKTVDGQVWLTAPNGSVAVDGTTVAATSADGAGGTIRANGGTVTVGGTAVLSASARKAGAAGGRILVGTDAMGGVNLARKTTIADGATLAAAGKGGGRGGTIETSAHALALGKASVTAGAGGSWLLDPDDLTIDNAAAGTIDSALDIGTNVTEQTSASVVSGAGVSSSGNGDIVVNAPLSWSGTGTLTLTAYHSITLNAGITVSGTGRLTLTTNNTIGGTGDGAVNFGSSAIQFTSSNVTAANTATNSPLTINGNGYTLITTPTELQNAVGLSGYYALARPIDMGGFGNFTPIGLYSTTPFLGTFDGLGNTIANLTINGGWNTYVGLFGQVGDVSGKGLGVVQNVGLVGGSITAPYSTYVGALVGWNDGTLRNVYTTASVSGGGSSPNDIGGLVGVNFTPGTITNAYATGTVSGSGSGWSSVGGLVGENDGAMSNVYATGAVTGTGSNDVGGLVGYNGSTISNAYATGAVSGRGSVGGLVGENGNTISNAYATGSVWGSGVGSGSGLGYIGGLTGKNEGIIENAYETGGVSGVGTVGALVGQNDFSVSGGYFGSTTSGQANGVGGGASGGITGLNTAALEAALPSGFSTSVWGNAGNQTTPYLRSLAGNQVFEVNDSASTLYTVILDTAQLQAMQDNLGGHYVLGGTIDASGVSNFTPIGRSSSSAFSGKFDGLGHTINNLTINDTTDPYGGLFGYVSSTGGVSHVGLVGGTVTGTNYVGGLVGYNNGKITDAYATGPVNATGTRSNVGSNVGGLVGLNDSSGQITDAYATGPVNATGNYSNVGGLVGLNNGLYGQITDAYATGAVNATGTYSYVGGLVGWNGSIITDAYATGAVNATGAGSDVGGLIGRNGSSMVTDVYAIGAVNPTNTSSNVGGLVGYNSGKITDGYWDTTASGRPTGMGVNSGAGNVTGLTTEQWLTEGPMVGGSSYGFVNSGAWFSGSPYPVLSALPFIVVSAAGSQTYGQSNLSATVLAFSGTGAVMLMDASNLTWHSPLLSTTSAAGSTGAMYGTGATAAGSQITYYAIDTVVRAPLTVTALNQTGTYGQAPTLGTSAYSTSGLVNGDTVSGVTLATAATGRSAVGNYGITASAAQGSGLANYAVTYQPGTLTIDPAALTVTALNQSSTYGQAPSLDGSAYSVSGLVNGDTISGVTLATVATNKSGAGTYAITASGAASSAPANYTIAYQPGTLTIDPAALTVTALNQTSTYGQAPSLDGSAYSVSGLVNGDSISGVTLATAATGRSAVGNYDITASAAQGSGLSNYAVTYQPGTLTIDPAALTVTALNQSSTYGQAPNLGTSAYSTTGLVNGDSISGVTLATAATGRSAVGNYDITASAAQGSGLANYAVTYQP
ncbi:GLUG motif-containing protein, partial [Gluconacetobacter liquefaciens]